MRRLGHVVIAVSVLAATASLTPLATPAAAATTTSIGFEDLADGTAVGAQYSGLGVQLDPAASLVVETNLVAHGGSRLVRATDSTCGIGSSAITFSILFSTPRTTVGLWVHDANAGDMTSRLVTMQGVTATGGSAAMTSLSTTGGTDWQQLLLVADPGKTIDHATVTVTAGTCQMLFDDLSFDAPASVLPPAVAWEDAATSPVAVERGGSTVTTPTLRRNNGSTGRVNLAVTGLPSGVTGVVSPAQANGSALRSPVTVTLSGSATAAPTTAPVQATLTATPVDSTAGPATAVTTTFPVTVVPPSVTLALAAPAPTDLYRGDTLTLSAVLTRHSLSTGLVSLSATGPPEVMLRVTPSSVTGSAV